ncbi:MAG: hypothetical protein GWN32_18270, partial [Gemmatimonadetes bacterium]|nr:hypothetical protein [Gemmatimonadota bacterium]
MIQEPNTVEELIETISAHEVGMPVAEMSRLLEVGAAAAGPVAEAVERWRDDEGRELLWLVVVLGELRRPAGIEPLLDLLQRKGWTELQAAAADALAKIGGPALPALLDRIGAAGPDERVWIYASLGWIGGDDAYAALLAALEDDAEVSGVAALALSDLGRREAIPAIYEALTRSAAWQRPDFETALRALHHGQPTARPQDADWRIRYRRLPRYGHSIPSWAVVAALVLDDPETQREMSDIPVRPLEDIVAEPPEPDEPPQICDDCGAPVEEPTGLPVCPDTALPAALLQVRLLEDAREQGFEFVYELWNDVEVAFPLMEMDEIDPPDWKDE